LAVNVLHISESDRAGGAARAAWKLHRDLRSRGHVSRMLVGRKQSADRDVRSVKRGNGWRAADRLAGEALDRLGLQYVFYPSSFAVARDPWFRAADVVQLHNLHGSYFSYSALPLLSRRKPVVWLLHDMWAFTGHIAYSLDCERWRHGCGSCPYLHEYPALPRDTTAALWRWKRAVYARSRLTLVTPSRWLASLVRESPLLGRFPVRHIPYAVDTEAFAPGDRAAARRALDLPPERPIVLFVASDVADPRKGFHALEQAVRGLGEPPLVVVAGAGEVRSGIETRGLAELADGRLADAYRAADVVALPSLADNFPNVAIEALACGRPVVARPAGGIGEAVRHLETGWLGADLAAGLRELLADGELRERLGRTGREVAEREYGLSLQTDRYLELYAELAGG
jgi:glycosyltransferase involved in cell wall biosynthesis